MHEAVGRACGRAHCDHRLVVVASIHVHAQRVLVAGQQPRHFNTGDAVDHLGGLVPAPHKGQVDPSALKAGVQDLGQQGHHIQEHGWLGHEVALDACVAQIQLALPQEPTSVGVFVEEVHLLCRTGLSVSLAPLCAGAARCGAVKRVLTGAAHLSHEALHGLIVQGHVFGQH